MQKGVPCRKQGLTLKRFLVLLQGLTKSAAKENMYILKFDVKTTFLNGNLKEQINMKHPEACDDGTGRLWKLEHSLYGLK